MVKRLINAPITPSQELRNFTNRVEEQAAFRRILSLTAGTSLPVLSHYGVGGIGKSWLLRRLKSTLGGVVPCALIDFDPRSGGIGHPPAVSTCTQEARGDRLD